MFNVLTSLTPIGFAVGMGLVIVILFIYIYNKAINDA